MSDSLTLAFTYGYPFIYALALLLLPNKRKWWIVAAVMALGLVMALSQGRVPDLNTLIYCAYLIFAPLLAKGIAIYILSKGYDIESKIVPFVGLLGPLAYVLIY